MPASLSDGRVEEAASSSLSLPTQAQHLPGELTTLYTRPLQEKVSTTTSYHSEQEFAWREEKTMFAGGEVQSWK
jgi:fructose-bisphosphate aldolase class 1